MKLFKSILLFFKKDSVRVFLELSLKLLKIILGNVANNLSNIAQEEVQKAEASGKSGQDKYETAYKAIRARLPQVRESAINLAIELAVNAFSADK